MSRAGRLGDLTLAGLGPPVEPIRERLKPIRGRLTGAAMNPVEQILEAFMERVRQVVREELAARAAAPATEMVSVAKFAAEHSLCTATVRAMIRDGRLQATRIGKRAVRIRRDATIGQSASGRTAPGAETPAAIADRILARLR